MPNRHWLQFSLRGCLILTTAACLWLGWQTEKQRRRHDAIRAVEALGGRVIFGRFFFNRLLTPNSLDQRYEGGILICSNDRTPDDVSPSLADEALRYVGCLSGVELLSIRSIPITDAGLRYIRGMNDLREVFLDHTQVTAAGEADLRKSLPNCRLITRIPDSPNTDPDPDGPPDWLTRRPFRSRGRPRRQAFTDKNGS
jgi:hypothetical protein